MLLQYGELRPTNGWDLLVSLGHHCKFQRVSRLGSVTARHSSSGHQSNFVALNRGRHLYSEGRPSRWALAHILVLDLVSWWMDHAVLILGGRCSQETRNANIFGGGVERGNEQYCLDSICLRCTSHKHDQRQTAPFDRTPLTNEYWRVGKRIRILMFNSKFEFPNFVQHTYGQRP